MIRSYTYPLKPNKTQEVALTSILRACCVLYNAALEERVSAYKKLGKSVSKFDQTKSLTQIRSEIPEYNAISVHILRSALTRIERSFQAFFRRCKSGAKPGFPRYKSRDRYKSFSFSSPSVDGNKVLIPKFGYIRFNRYRDFKGTIKEARVKQTASGWSLTLVGDVGPVPEKKVDLRNSVGIDLGLKSFAVLSNGKQVENPRFLKQSQDLIARRQQSLARKQRGSNSRKHAKRLVGKAYEHLHNQRLDFARKLAKELVTTYDAIFHEDLQIARMVQEKEQKGLGKSILDASWGILMQCISCKAEEAGKIVAAVDPRNTTQRCSGCSRLVPKDLSVRIHDCPHCGLVMNRDLNAALNIRALGLSAVLENFSRPNPL